MTKPVFITGHIKTGTSLMASLLDEHSELMVFPEELFLFSKYAQLHKNNKVTLDDFWELFFKDIQIQKLFGTQAKGLFGQVDYSDFDAESFKDKCLTYSKAQDLQKWELHNVFEIIFKAFAEIIQNNPNKRWVEKTPMNEFNFFYWKKFYPKAQFLYMTRHPFEVFSSIKKKRTIEKQPYSVYDFIVKYLTSLKLANFLQKQYPDNFIIIDLNDLKNNTAETMKAISAFLNINFSESLLRPTKLGKSWQGNSMFSANDKTAIHKQTFVEERNQLISPTEKQVIHTLLIENKKPLFDIKFINYNFKNYLKVIFLDLWLNQFIQKKNLKNGHKEY